MNTEFFRVVVLCTGLLLGSWASAASVTVNGSGSNFIINKVAGFDGTDGVAREAAFVAAAQVWADILVSPVDIVIDASFSSSLYCNSSSATLGSAGPLSTYLSSGADSFGLQNNVWYPTALINAHYGSDFFPANADITAEFNADIGMAECLSSSGWYYGTDGNVPAGEIDFYEVVLHELGHGLGILSLVNSDGTNNSGVVDIFTTFLADQSTGKDWSAMTTAERNASVVNDGNVVWSGAGVTALAGDLSSGVNNGKVQMYAPSNYESGSSISHFDTALTPDELMEPQYTGNASYDHSIALLSDIGWDIFTAPSNNVPVITGQSGLSVNEDETLTLAYTDLAVTDTDNSYPADFSMTIGSGDNYTVSGFIITPAENYFGSLTVPVTVNDGTDDSAVFNVTVSVASVNDLPVISAQSTLTVDEDGNLNITPDAMTISDPDDTVFTVTLSNGANYAVSGSTITPAQNFNGTLTVPVTVNDGEADSDSYDLTVTVNAVNDAPVISATPLLAIDEDTSYSFTLSDFTTFDVEGNTLTLNILSGSNYSLAGNTLTPDADFFGTLSVSARVFDGGSFSATESFDLTVNAVNDAPLITATPSVSLNEDTSYTFALTDFTVEDAESDALTLSIIAGENYSVDGLVITPAENFFGELTVSASVSDGVDASAAALFPVTVLPVNDPPTIRSQALIGIAEGGSYELSLADLVVDDVDDNSFTLIIDNGANYIVLGSVITPDTDFAGTLTVPIRVNDGEASSALFELTIDVSQENDAPIITRVPAISINEDTSVTLGIADFTVTDVDSTNHQLTLLPGDNYSLVGNTVFPATHFHGELLIDAYVSDAFTDSAVVTLSMTVNAVNDAPVLTGVPASVVTLPDDYVSAFSVSDVDSTTLNYSLETLHGWLSINTAGELSGTPTGADIGTELVTVTVSDGELSDAFSFELTVADATSADLTVGLSVAEPLAALNSATELTLRLENQGPAVFADGFATVSLPAGASVSVLPTACTLTALDLVRCEFADLQSQTTFTLTINQSVAVDALLQANVVGTVTDPVALNDTALLNVWFAADSASPAETATLLSGVDSRAAALGDLDSDGQPELLVANGSGQAHSSFQFDAAFGLFSPDRSLGTSVANQIVVAHLNNDALLDVIIANEGPNAVYLAISGAAFAEPQWLGDAASQDIAAVDLNNDGFVDLVFANNGPNQIYLNDQAGGFVVADSFGTADSAAIDVIDFSGDGYFDLIVANRNDDDLVYINSGAEPSAGLLQSSPVQVGSMLTQSNALLVLDADGDGVRNEVVIGRNVDADTSSLEILQLNGSVFSTYFTLQAGSVTSVDGADYNGDGLTDLIVLNSEGVVQLFLQESGSFLRRHIFSAPDSNYVMMSDINDDGSADIVLANNADAASQLMLSDDIPVPVAPTSEPETDPGSDGETVQQTTIVVTTKSGSLGGVLLIILLTLMVVTRTARRQPD